MTPTRKVHMLSIAQRDLRTAQARLAALDKDIAALKNRSSRRGWEADMLRRLNGEYETATELVEQCERKLAAIEETPVVTQLELIGGGL